MDTNSRFLNSGSRGEGVQGNNARICVDDAAAAAAAATDDFIHSTLTR